MGTQTTPTIAIVDDDESVRSALRNFLRAAGWGVEAFASAIDYLQSNRMGDTACLITDVRMPGMTGAELHERLMDLGHAIPTIFITAFLDDSTRARLNVAGAIAVYSKPVELAALSELLAHVLGKP